MNRDVQIAQEILSQLGGRMFCAMVGAKHLLAVKSGLQFSIGDGAKDAINKVLITLESNDTYTVEFWFIGKTHALRESRHEGIYNDMLQDVFETYTGFFTTLHARR